MLSENILISIKENQDLQIKIEKFKYLHNVLFSFYEPLSEAVSSVQSNVAEIRTVFSQEYPELKNVTLNTKNEIIQKMQEVNTHYFNQLNTLEKAYPAMKLSFQAWNIYWEMDDVIQNFNTCFLNNEFETNYVETHLLSIDDMIFDFNEQLKELTCQLKKEVDQLNIELGWTYRM
ncbi:MAG: hypothetical protein FWH46_03365 [Methanimicrococcus sp.]|nr:hypothetical protein [Methanimicrococcus sp.]